MGSLRILLVDDHEAVRRGIRTLLSARADWMVCGEAVDGLDAVQKARALRPNLVLMDISMPRMNGLDATLILRKEFPDSSVVIVSQNDPSIAKRQAMEVDAAGYVVKSGLSEHLLPTLDKILSDAEAKGLIKRRPVSTKEPLPGWLSGGGSLGQLIREHDWSATPLGPIEQWPQSLKTSVNLMLNSRHPMWIGWGREMTFLYNDAYIAVLSLAKHPKCLGRPANQVWPEIWDICGPLADKVFAKGEATFIDDVRLFMNRGNFLEETYYSFSYSPIHDESGKVAGLFCPSTETTAKILNTRRLRTLSELAARALVERTTSAACASSFATMAKNPDDIPFALLYLLDSERKFAFLEQSNGVSEDLERITPSQIPLFGVSEADEFWRISKAMASGQSETILLNELDAVPAGAAGQRVVEAVTLPVATSRQDRPFGVLIAGINPTRILDSEYQTFFELMASQVANAIRNAQTAEDDRKRAEALAEVDRAKTVFFSNVSHEFRTPLTLMLGPVEDLLSKSHTDLSPAAKNQLELVNRNGNRLLRLVNTLLDFSRIEAGRMQVNFEPTDLAAFTLELASVFRSATEKAGLVLELDCPELDEPVFIDRDMWEKIVLNLISNAFKFTFTGKIGVTLRQAGDALELRVSDSGVGIRADELSKLFDRFHRVQNTRSRTHEGTGIGLALVQELAKLHGGTVTVESKLGAGSTFIVTLPRSNEQRRSERRAVPRSSASTAVGAAPFLQEALAWLPNAENAERLEEFPSRMELLQVSCPPVGENVEKRPRVLIADDNADMRQYLARLLSERYNIQTVGNGVSALEAARQHRPDLVLTDVMMPELDGLGLLRELRADPDTRTIPIILLSARAGEESRVEGMEHGADDYLIKPFSARELLARVQTHLELSRVRNENEVALRQRTAQFEALVNAAPLGVYLIDADLRILQVNPAAQVTFENVPNVIGRDFAEVLEILWPKAYAEEVVGQFRHTLETGEPYVVPEKMEERSDTGAREIYEWQINRIPLPDGRFGVVCYYRDISRFVLAREALRENENRLRHLAAIVDSSDDGIISKNLNGVITSWNNTAERLFGYNAKEAVGQHINLILPLDRRQEETMILSKIRAGERIEHFETVRVRKDGRKLDISLTISPVRDATGKIIGASKIARDITGKKEAEEALQQRERRLTLAAEAAELGIWHWYPGEDRVTWENDRMFEILRRSKEEGAINAQEFSQQVIHPDDRARFERALAETVKGGKRFYNQSRARRTDGSVGWLEFTGQLESHHNGTPQRVLGTLMDITGRKRAQELEREMAAEALAATAKFRAVFEQTSVFAGIMTLEGVLIDANQMFLAACGYEAKNELGKPFWETSWWRNSKEVQNKIRTATQQAARGTAFRETLTYHWADGSERLVDFSLHPIRDAEGTILFLHPTGVDITDLKRAEENYRELAETLEEEVQARTKDLQQRSAEVLQQSEQLRELSHRLMQIQDDERRRVARELHDSAGQILTALSMNLSRIVRQTQKGEAVVEKDAQESQALVQELSKEIRTMSYLLHPPLLDECGLSEALQMYIRGLRERSGLQVSLHIAEDFGRLAPEMELVLFRIVQECLTNVHRHSESKVATIQISRTANSVVLKVKDEGKGIPPERLAQIQSQGAGVGVRGMRERVLQLNGKLDIQSGSAGTTITVTFPVRAGDAAPSTNQGISEGAGRPAPSLSSSRGSLT